MTGKSLLRLFSIFALIALVAIFVALAGSSAFAATTQVYLDVNVATAGDGNPGIGASANATYLWSTSAAGAYWNTSNVVTNTNTPLVWTSNNYIANFGAFSTDTAGWSYTMAVDSTVNKLQGVNVGASAAGTLTVVTTGAGVNFYLGANETWTIATGSNLVFGNNLSLNLNHDTLTFVGGGNVSFSSSSNGFFNTTSHIVDDLTGLMTINHATGAFSSDSGFTVNSGSLALGAAGALGNGTFIIGATSSTTLLNSAAGPLTLSSTGPVAINGSFMFGGSNDFTFGSGTVSLGVTPTITVASNTLTFPQPISGAHGLNMVGPGTLALNASNTYTGATSISNGTLSMGVNGALGSGGVTVQSGGVLAVAAAVSGPLGNGNVTIQPGGLLDTSAFAGTGYTMNGGVLTAGRTASYATDINGNINLNNTTVNLNGGNTGLSTLTVNGSMGLSGGTLDYFGGDQISLASAGALTLTNTTYIVPIASLSSGTYAVFNNFTGLAGGTANLALAGAFGSNPRQMYSFDVSTGTAVNLIVSGSAGNLFWNGGTNSTWDTSAVGSLGSQSWFNANTSANDYFYTGDSAIFTDTPGTATTVNINGTVQPGSLTMSNTNVNYTFSGTGSIVGVNTSVQMNGPGAVTIANSNGNSYGGGTFVSGGSLNANVASSLGSGLVSISGGVLNANVASALGTAPVSLSGGLLNVGNSGALGTGALTFSGGSLDNTSGSPATLSGNNPQNWSGSFTFIGSNPLNTGTGAVALNAPTVTVNASTLTVGGVMSGAGPLIVAGGGVLLSTNTNTYTAGTTVNSGTFQLGTGQAGQDGALAAGGVTINAGGTLIYDLYGPQSVAYLYTGAGSLTKLGTGNLTLTGQSTTYTGTTSVNGGTLTLDGPTGGNGTLLKSPLVIGSGAQVNLANTDTLGYNAGAAPITIYGIMDKTANQSETLERLITLSGGTMTATGTAGAPNGSWNFYTGAVISTATGTTSYITGGATDIFSIRAAAAYFSLGASSTLNISVPIMQNSGGGSSPNCNITGPGTMIFSGTNLYGNGGATNAVTVQVGYAITTISGTPQTAGNLELVGSSTFPRTADGSFQVAYGSTLAIVNGAIVFVDSDLKLGSNVAGSSGTANQTGGALAVLGVDTGNGNRSLVIGEYPNETSAYNLSGGTLSVPNGWTYLGYSGSGVLNISAGTATLLGINYGNGQGGALNLSDNGVLSIGASGIVSNGPASSATLSGGTLAAYASWSTTLPMTLAGAAGINPQGNTIALNGALSGGGSLNLVGPGTLALNTSNGYSGGTMVGSGVVRIGNINALGTGPLYLNGGAVSSNGVTAYALANPLVLSGGTLGDTVNTGALTFTAASGTLAQNATLAANSAVTIGGNLTDSGSGFGLTKNGPGTLTLAGNNTFSGSTTVNAGGGLYINGTNATSSIFVAQGATLGGSGTAASAAVTVDGGSTPASGGNLDLGQNGGLTLSFGSLYFKNHANITLPNLTSTATLALQTGPLQIDGFANSLQFAFAPAQGPLANGTYRLLAYSSIFGLGSGTAAFSIPLLQGRQTGQLVDYASEIDYLVTGPTPYWNGQQPDWKSTNAWTLNPGGGLTSFQGGDTDIFDDTAGTAGSNAYNMTINQGNVNPYSATFNSTTASYTISGSNGIAGGAYLAVNGGALTINNSNSYFGGTQLNAGVLNLNNALAIGTGPLTIGGGALGNTSGGTIALSTNNAQAWNADFAFNGPYDLNLGTGAVTLNGGRTVTLAAGTLTVGGPIGGVAASLTVTGTGGLVLGGANSYDSGTFILGGNVTASDNSSPLGSGPVSMGPASGSATLNLTGTAPAINGLSSSGAGTSMVVLGNAANSSATTLTINNATLSTFGGTIGDLSQTNSAAVGSLVVNATGTLTLAGSNTYVGSTTVSSGTLQLGSPTALYAGAAIGNAIVNGTLDLNGYSANVGGLTGAGIVLSSSAGAGTLTAGFNNASSNFGGPIAASVLNLVKTGTGTLTLTGADSAGTSTISGGTLQIGNGGTTGSIANAATVVDNGALVYNMGNAAATVPSGGITGTGTVTATVAGTTAAGDIVILGNVTTGGSQSYDATIATHARGTGIEIGPATLTTAATMTLATTAAGSSITLIGDVGQNHDATTTFPQSLVLCTSACNGTINLNISIGYAGDWYSLAAFTANAGTGAINWTGTYANPAENQTTPISLTGAINFATNFALHAANTLPMTFNPTGPSTLSGIISGGVSVTAAGPGTLTVTAAETYTGSTTISGGALQLGNGIAGQDGSIAGTTGVADSASLLYNIAGSQTASYTISGNGSVTKSGSGFVQLAGANIYSGGTIVNNGVLQMGNASAIGGGAGGLAANGGTLDLAGFSVTVPSFSGAAGTVTTSVPALAATLSVNQSIATAFGGTISDGAGTLALDLGGGTLTLSGTGTYTGGTYVEGTGDLIVTTPNAIDINGVGTNLFVGDASELSLFGGVVSAGAGTPAGRATAAVPEPGTLALLAAGAAVAVVAVRRGRRIRPLRQR